MGLYAMIVQWAMEYKLHPILVNFTAALVPVSLFSDLMERLSAKKSFGEAGWWTLFYAACVTPLTAVAGWLFWMQDDVRVPGMEIHKWLGTSLSIVLPGLMFWRWRLHACQRRPGVAYFLTALLIVVALIYQGSLGGNQVFRNM